jgi:hypothetical protein
MKLPMTSGGRVLRLSALAVYLLALLVAALFFASGLFTLAEHPDTPFMTPEGLAQSGFVFFILVVSTTWLQYRRPFSALLGFQIAIVGVLLFYCALNHAFPETSRLFAIPHDILGFLFTALNVREIWAGGKGVA